MVSTKDGWIGVLRSFDTDGFELRMAICTDYVAQM
jgi:hypothetical protein